MMEWLSSLIDQSKNFKHVFANIWKSVIKRWKQKIKKQKSEGYDLWLN